MELVEAVRQASSLMVVAGLAAPLVASLVLGVLYTIWNLTN